MISIIMPVYNSEKYLPAMLDSILEQSYKDIELILINDGSTDGSFEVCRKYAKNFSNIKIYDRENSGVSITRNFGISQATGDFIWFVDSDDVLYPDALAKAVKVQEKYDADIVIGGMDFCFTDSGDLWRKTIKDTLLFERETFSDNYCYLYENNYITSICNKLIRRSLIVDNSITLIEGLSMFEDYIFSMDCLLCASKVVCIADAFYAYQLRSSGTLSKRYKENIDIMFELLRARMDVYVSKLGAECESTRRSLNELMIYFAYECLKNESKAICAREKIKHFLHNQKLGDTLKAYKGHGKKYRAVRFLMMCKATEFFVWFFKIYNKKSK